MPRRVTVAIRHHQQESGALPSSFPKPPDPTGRRNDNDNVARDDEKERDDSLVVAGTTEDPSLRAGFLPPAPKEGAAWNTNTAGDAGDVNGNDNGHAANATANNTNTGWQGQTNEKELNDAWNEWHQRGQPWQHYGNWWPPHYYDDRHGQPHSGAEQYYQEFLPPNHHAANEDAVDDGKEPAPPGHHHHPPPHYPYHQQPYYAPPPAKKPRHPHQPPYQWPPLPPADDYKAREQQLQRKAAVERLPLYPFDDSFLRRSWDDMLALYRAVQSSNSNNDVETVDPATPQSLTLTSWIKELRWTRRARAPSSEKSPKATRGRDKHPSFPPLVDSLTLTPDRIQMLDSLNFPWGNNLSSWQKWLDDLMHFRVRQVTKKLKLENNDGLEADAAEEEEEGANVPLKYPEYPSLGNFVNRQRTEYRKLLQGRNSSMTQSKMEDLNRVGFLWSVREGGHTSWEARFDELKEYKRVHGHCNVPKLYKPNPSLGYWVNEVSDEKKIKCESCVVVVE